jgi:Raf kinase inhibitor-like YbhB/YbcL family protein
MELTSLSIVPSQQISTVFAMGKPHPETHATFADNVSPHLRWSGAPEGTRSFAIVVHDSDAPTVPDDVNQEGRRVPAELPRADFFHWVLVDVPADQTEIVEAAFSAEVTPGGKPGPELDDAPRAGLNSYTGWFAGDPDMGGEYFGYDGPFPPWNDERTHNYTFTVYALDVDRAPVEGTFDGPAVLAAIEDHILDSASFEATYRIAD